MIVEIPTPEEFKAASLNVLNLAWDTAIGALLELREWSDFAAYADEDAEPEMPDGYWEATQPALSNALTLVQQSAELALKGRIAAVNPLSLIANDPKDWPKRCETEDVPFSMFKTLDASELVRVHDTISSHRLGPEFAAFFDEIRRQRNQILHKGRSDKAIDVRNLLVIALRLLRYLYPETHWPRVRRAYLEQTPLSRLHSTDHVNAVLVRESDVLVEHLGRSDLETFFDFDKKARKYICPHCHHGRGDHGEGETFALAQLAPNAPTATTIGCFVCEQTTTVTRKPCSEPDCKSNVIVDSDEFGTICLVCLADG